VVPAVWRPLTANERAARCHARKRGDVVTPWPRRAIKKDDPTYELVRQKKWRRANPEKVQAQRQRIPHRSHSLRSNVARNIRRWRARSHGACDGTKVHCWHDTNQWVIPQATNKANGAQVVRTCLRNWWLGKTLCRIIQLCCWCQSVRAVSLLAHIPFANGRKHGRHQKISRVGRSKLVEAGL